MYIGGRLDRDGTDDSRQDLSVDRLAQRIRWGEITLEIYPHDIGSVPASSNDPVGPGLSAREPFVLIQQGGPVQGLTTEPFDDSDFLGLKILTMSSSKRIQLGWIYVLQSELEQVTVPHS